MAKKVRRSHRGAILIVSIIIFCIVFGAGIGLLAAWVKSTPDVDPAKEQQNATTFVYGENDWLIARLHAGEHRIPVKLEQIPQHMQEAIVAIEDERFYQHHGVDPKSVIRAGITYIKNGFKKTIGGSTITQQYAKIAYLTNKKTFFRKVQDQVLAIKLERKYTKQEILEMYLNEIYFGSGAYGIQAASQIYFGKNVEDLSLSEAALLAGVVQRPEALSPYNNLEAAVNRRNLVIDQMVKTNKIDSQQAEVAKNEEVNLAGKKSIGGNQAQYFVDYITQYLIEKYGYDLVYKGGLKVYTTLNEKMQAAAEETIKTLPEGEKDKKGITQPQGALISLDPKTGYIKALVGGRDRKESEWNRVSQAARQPGSSFKPFVYAVALQNGITPATIEIDEPININGYAPKNSGNIYEGPMTIRKAIEKSKNTIAVKTAYKVGINNVIQLTQDLGISTLVTSGEPNDRGLSLALGGTTKGIYPLEMAEAYTAFANKGVKSEPLAILRVEDRKGNVLEENKPKQKAVLSEEVAYVLTDMLKSVINGSNGTGRSANIGRPAAGKTGTTNDYNDAWFVGYTPDLVTAVWVGSDEKYKDELTYMQKNRVSSGFPARMWARYMKQALAGIPAKDFPQPSGVVGPLAIDLNTGLLAGPDTPPESIVYEVFIEGTQPTTMSSYYQGTYICPDSGLLATDFCPNPVKIPYTNPEEIPTGYCTIHKAPINDPGVGQDDNNNTSQEQPVNSNNNGNNNGNYNGHNNGNNNGAKPNNNTISPHVNQQNKTPPANGGDMQN
jgi:penicillin-binding protein 1A